MNPNTIPSDPQQEAVEKVLDMLADRTKKAEGNGPALHSPSGRFAISDAQGKFLDLECELRWRNEGHLTVSVDYGDSTAHSRFAVYEVRAGAWTQVQTFQDEPVEAARKAWASMFCFASEPMPLPPRKPSLAPPQPHPFRKRGRYV